LISLDKNLNNPEMLIGKLKAKGKQVFVLYDTGKNYVKLSHFSLATIRAEHGLFLYRYEPC
jgi:hypothetical protein